MKVLELASPPRASNVVRECAKACMEVGRLKTADSSYKWPEAEPFRGAPHASSPAFVSSVGHRSRSVLGHTPTVLLLSLDGADPG